VRPLPPRSRRVPPRREAALYRLGQIEAAVALQRRHEPVGLPTDPEQLRAAYEHLLHAAPTAAERERLVGLEPGRASRRVGCWSGRADDPRPVITPHYAERQSPGSQPDLEAAQRQLHDGGGLAVMGAARHGARLPRP
jgi:hypothetical protein